MSDFIDDAIENAGITLSAEKTAPGVFRCTMVSHYGEMVRDITVKEGVDETPGVANLLYHFTLQTQSVDICDDLEDWADEYSYDASNEAIKAKYEQYCRDAKDLRALLGNDAFENLMGGLAISQAIGNARPR